MTKRRVAIVLALSCAAWFTLTASSRRHAAEPSPPPVVNLNVRRSLIVTNQVILDGFSFDRVLNALIARSGVHGLTAEQLYRQWFDTQNPKPGLADASGPHCDDFETNGSPSFNGFPRRCPTIEGALAAQPYATDEYIPIALVNRFDLAPPDGSNCGQYRIIFARKSPPGDRLHIIFESNLPNPTPEAGLAGCRPVAEFWAELTNIDSRDERREKLETFFFDGIGGFPPAVDPDHYGKTGGGVRTTQVSGTGHATPRMYQFRVTKECSTNSDCTLRMTPDVLENFPFGPLFDASADLPQSRAFRDAFVGQVANLAIDDVNLYFMNIPRELLIAESDPLDTEAAFAYEAAFAHGKTSPAGAEFRNRIQQELTRIGSDLTPEQIVARAQTLSCTGCHLLGADVGDNIMFPPSIDGTQQVTEDTVQDGRYVISAAMQNVFLPHRTRILTEFLTTGKAPEHSETIGGGRAIQ